VNDDIVWGVMGIGHARTMSVDASGNYRRQSYANLNTPDAIARRCDCDLFNPTIGE
jgi:hypothetical protein